MYFILYNNYANLSLRGMRRFYMYEGRLCLMVRFRQVLHIFQRTLVSFSAKKSKRADMSRVMRKPDFCICENKDADQLRGNHEADQRLCFRKIVQSLYYVNPKSQASSHLLWLYSPVYVGPGRKPRRPVFSQRCSYEMFGWVRTPNNDALWKNTLSHISRHEQQPNQVGDTCTHSHPCDLI